MCACEQKKAPIVLEPLPNVVWHEVEVTTFLTKDAWTGQRVDWNLVSKAVSDDVAMPEALETKLLREDRELWKQVLANMEVFDQQRKSARVLVSTTVPAALECNPPSAVFSLHQRAMFSRVLQLHRNVLWRLGRLEMASRYVKSSLQQVLHQYAGGRIKDADRNIVEPIKEMTAQIQDIQRRYPVPNGVWTPGELHFRMARLSLLAPVLYQAKNAFTEWNQQIVNSTRWQYLAGSNEMLIDAYNTWVTEYDGVLSAYRYLAEATQSLEQSFTKTNNMAAYPCVQQNLKRMRIISGLFQTLLPMQWALTKARMDALSVKDRIQTQDYAALQHEFMTSEIERIEETMDAQSSKLARAIDLLLMMWDETNYKVWAGLPEFIDPIHHHSKVAVQDAQTWRMMYNILQGDLVRVTQNLKAEPEQPLNKRGKPYDPPIKKILEDIESPSRIDEVEHGLLSISEIEAHLVAIRDELLRLCMDGACHNFPEAELAKSPRKSQWVVSWRQSTVSERTIGHSLIVLKLCQLHLARLVQRLTEIYAWFSETSNVDITWKSLKSWQRIWTLYAEPNGTYANFLRSISALDSQISSMVVPQKNREESPELLELLSIQDSLFDLTVDYARFVDSKQHTPVAFDDIIDTWSQVQAAFENKARLTEERDLKNNPDGAAQIKRVRKDIDR